MPLLKSKFCELCGRDYEPTGSNQKYCGGCSVKIRKQYLHSFNKKWRLENKGDIKKYNKEYYEQNREKLWAWHKKYKKDNPKIVIAHSIIRTLIASGKITRPDKCSNCSKKCKLEGHHPDYDKPAEVVWLCPSCHKYLHKKETF